MWFWTKLWQKPKWAYNLGGLVMMLGILLGWLAIREGTADRVRPALILGAAFSFAFWALLTSVGSQATFAAALERRLRDRG